MTRTEAVIDAVTMMLRNYAPIIDHAPVRSLGIRVVVAQDGAVKVATITPELESTERPRRDLTGYDFGANTR